MLKTLWSNCAWILWITSSTLDFYLFIFCNAAHCWLAVSDIYGNNVTSETLGFIFLTTINVMEWAPCFLCSRLGTPGCILCTQSLKSAFQLLVSHHFHIQVVVTCQKAWCSNKSRKEEKWKMYMKMLYEEGNALNMNSRIYAQCILVSKAGCKQKCLEAPWMQSLWKHQGSSHQSIQWWRFCLIFR